MTTLPKKVLFAILAILLGLNLMVFSGILEKPAKKVISGASAQQEKVKPKKEVRKYQVKKGDNFSAILSKFGFSRKTSNKIFQDVKDVYDFSNIETGNLFHFVYLKDEIQRIKYDINQKKQVVLERNSSSSLTFSASSKKIPYKIRHKKVEATIDSSLFTDARKNNVPDEVILQMSEIFAWDIDFSAEIKKGDSFSLVYRKLYRNGRFVDSGRIVAARFNNQEKNYWAFYFKKKKGDGSYYDMKGRSMKKQFLRSPLNYSHISSGFSYNRLNPVTRSYGAHRAVDYAAPPGTPVYATGDGRISYAGWGQGKGLFVKIRHGGVYTTIYAHLSDLARGVKTGTRVEQGSVIGYVGSTGMSTGPHLHYVMKKYGRHINPLTVDLPEGKPLPKKYKDEFQKVVEKYKPKLQ
ncbi:MAG: peptidoglycan DD-metalloendopeptidase family protein [Candidatus Magasanikbacteria bacterium]